MPVSNEQTNVSSEVLQRLIFSGISFDHDHQYGTPCPQELFSTPRYYILINIYFKIRIFIKKIFLMHIFA